MNTETSTTRTRLPRRTDAHRRGIFHPESYTFFAAYWLNSRGGSRKAVEQVVTWVNSEDARDFKAELPYGDFGLCGVCGASFAMGEIWQHTDSMELVHIGHDCVDKYRMVSGTDWTAVADERRRAMKARKTAEKRRAVAAALLLRFPGLEEALKTDHYIVHSIAGRFESAPEYVSDAQVALVFKLQDEMRARAAKLAAREAEAKVDAPVGRQTFTGVLVSKRTIDSMYGARTVCTIKVETPEGVWLCSGSAPTGFWRDTRDAAGNMVSERAECGDTVTLSAELNALTDRREGHFAFFKRPTKATFTKKAA